ncbi:transporter substrate-binding domain-containing protein [Corynebacterium otitidis]
MVFSTLTRRGRLARPALAAALAGALAAGCADPQPIEDAAYTDLDLSPDRGLIRAEESPELAAAVPDSIKEDGKLTVAYPSQPGPPFALLATDNETPIGVEIDQAQLLADKLGLELDLQPINWSAWPLKLATGDVEVVHFNIGVTRERLERFDFATSRGALMAFSARPEFEGTIESYEDISGLRIAVGAGTTQERILLDWNELLEAEGKEPAELAHYANGQDMVLAGAAGRVDAIMDPSPSASYRESMRDDLVIVGRVNEGWPDETLIASTTKRGDGLAPVLAAAFNELIDEGLYLESLKKWDLSEEAIPESETHSLESYTDVEYD